MRAAGLECNGKRVIIGEEQRLGALKSRRSSQQETRTEPRSSGIEPEGVLMSATKPSISSEETRIMDREKQSVVQSYGRYPLVVDHGKGCQVCDLNGRSYLEDRKSVV